VSIVYSAYPLPEGAGINRNIETIRNPYCSISDVERRLHRMDLEIGRNTPEDYEEMVQEAIYEAEVEIDGITMSTFHKVLRQEWHDGQSSGTLLLEMVPIIELVKVKVWSPSFHTYNEYEGNNFIVDNDAGAVSHRTIHYTNTSILNPPLSAVGYAFLPGKKNVMFEYWFGWDDGVPDSGYHAGIRSATSKLAAAILLTEAETRQSQGLMSLNVSGQGAQYGRWTMAAQALRQEATQMAMRYRRQQIGGMYL